jgi:hypothetical protein
MIPPFTISGVLPPYLGVGPGASGSSGMSPYVVSMDELAHRFCTNSHRVDLLRGLIAFRKALKSLGIVQGVQWIDGSFCEDIEGTAGRSPNDIDLVTLFIRPAGLSDVAAWIAFVNANQTIFDRPHIRATYGCDAYYVDAGMPIGSILPQLTYWYGLFTHQRVSLLWKGLLQVPLVSDDDAALAFIGTLNFTP